LTVLAAATRVTEDGEEHALWGFTKSLGYGRRMMAETVTNQRARLQTKKKALARTPGLWNTAQTAPLTVRERNQLEP
jgi:hypothetical protein